MRDLAPHCTTPSAAAPKRERADAEANQPTKRAGRAGRKLPRHWAQEFLDFYGITNTLARPNNSAWVYAETIYFANFRDVRRPLRCHLTGAIACGAVPSTLRWDTACQCRRSSSQRGVRRAKNALHGCPASTLTQGSWCV